MWQSMMDGRMIHHYFQFVHPWRVERRGSDFFDCDKLLELFCFEADIDRQQRKIVFELMDEDRGTAIFVDNTFCREADRSSYEKAINLIKQHNLLFLTELAFPFLSKRGGQLDGELVYEILAESSKAWMKLHIEYWGRDNRAICKVKDILADQFALAICLEFKSRLKALSGEDKVLVEQIEMRVKEILVDIDIPRLTEMFYGYLPCDRQFNLYAEG